MEIPPSEYEILHNQTSSFRPGARFGSSAIRHESFGLETYSPYQDKDLCDTAVFDLGDLELCFGSAESALFDIERTTVQILDDGKFPLLIGGEHLVTLGAVRAAVRKYPDLHIIHFDAHATFAKDHTDMHRFSFDSLTSLIRDLQESNTPVYFTIDLDCLDPSVFPGTGTPEAGGVNFSELLDAILQASNANIIGADIGIRNYTEKDLKWVELAVEMKSLELPVETMIEYVSLGFHSDNVSEARTLI